MVKEIIDATTIARRLAERPETRQNLLQLLPAQWLRLENGDRASSEELASLPLDDADWEALAYIFSIDGGKRTATALRAAIRTKAKVRFGALKVVIDGIAANDLATAQAALDSCNAQKARLEAAVKMAMTAPMCAAQVEREASAAATRATEAAAATARARELGATAAAARAKELEDAAADLRRAQKQPAEPADASEEKRAKLRTAAWYKAMPDNDRRRLDAMPVHLLVRVTNALRASAGEREIMSLASVDAAVTVGCNGKLPNVEVGVRRLATTIGGGLSDDEWTVAYSFLYEQPAKVGQLAKRRETLGAGSSAAAEAPHAPAIAMAKRTATQREQGLPDAASMGLGKGSCSDLLFWADVARGNNERDLSG